MDFDQISYLTYWFNYLVAWAGHWLQMLKTAYFGQPAEIKVAIAVIVGSALTMIVIAALLLCRSLREWWHRRSLQVVKKKFGAKIDYVMSDPYIVNQNIGVEDVLNIFEVAEGEDMKSRLKNARSLITGKRDKRLFCQLVYERLLEDEGELCSLNNIGKMLEVLGLYRFLETEVDHGNWRTKVRSLNMMSMFRLKVDSWLTNALLLSNSQLVRRHAMHASVMSSADSNLEYFESDYFDRHCCIKDEIELGYSLQRRRTAGLQLPNLARLTLLQKHAEPQCVFVRLMRYFGQRDYCSQLKDLFLTNKDHRLAKEIACTWGYLQYTDGEELLKEALMTQSDDVQISFMQALTRMDTGHSLAVMTKIYQNAANDVICYEALRCLYNYGVAGKEEFKRLKESAKGTDKEVLFKPFEKVFMESFLTIGKTLDYQPTETTVYNVHE
mgnify:CR=1 FL=1